MDRWLRSQPGCRALRARSSVSLRAVAASGNFDNAITMLDAARHELLDSRPHEPKHATGAALHLDPQQRECPDRAVRAGAWVG